METKLIIAVCILIALGAITFFTYQWYQDIQKEKRQNELIGGSVADELHPKVVLGKKTSLATSNQLAQWAKDINDAVHIFKKNDNVSILSTYHNIKTQRDLSWLNTILKQDYGINIMDEFAKELTNDQVAQFVRWEKSLPIYV